MKLNLTINKEKKIIFIEPHERMANVLRREGYKGVKRGCDDGNCGACTILVNNRAFKSCLLFAAGLEGKEISTIEGLGSFDNLDKLQKAFIDEGAVQCGYCTPGMILSAKALLLENKNPTVDEIKENLAGNLCRCTGYISIVKAVKRASKE